MTTDTGMADGAALAEALGCEDTELAGHLQAALEHAGDARTRFHLRQAIQLLAEEE